jgi:diguanylate cyclase (GGDEF)-like protein/putative nucleotidyltransferase with HDIG domain/PAS domain S-box-containing protein
MESSMTKLIYMKASNRLDRFFHSMQDHIIILDYSGKLMEWNKPLHNEWHLHPGNFIGQYYYNVLPPEQCYLFQYALERLENEETVEPFDFLYHSNNREIWFSAQVTKVLKYQSQITDCYVVSLRDITERKRTEDEILYLSYHDKLTGVYNRRFYEEEIKRLDHEWNLPISIIIGDVNGLKIVNDAFGHVKGDEFLKKAAKSIQTACRPDDVVARWGGDEFVILLPRTGTEGAESVVKRIKKLYSDETVNAINIGISLGWDTKTSADQNIMKVLNSAEDYMYQHKTVENKSVRGNIIDTIINTLHEKNSREEQHSKRVSKLSQKIGKAMGLPDIEIHKLKVVGLLHDIGKIAIGDGILDKPETLSEAELNEIRRHPDIGYRILSSSNEMLDLAEFIWAHHERWDGKGYPKGLSGDEIPQLSRVVAIADSYDAMTSERPYRKSMEEREVISEIRKNAGTQFDPQIAKIFVEKVLEKPWN